MNYFVLPFYKSFLDRLSVITNDLHIVSVPFAPNEANPKLFIDADAVLPGPVTFQRLQTIAWGNA